MDKDELVQELLRIRRERDQLAAQLKLESAQHESELSALKRRVLELERSNCGNYQKNNARTSAERTEVLLPLQTTAELADKDGTCTTDVRRHGLPVHFPAGTKPELTRELSIHVYCHPSQDNFVLATETACTSGTGDNEAACASATGDIEGECNTTSLENVEREVQCNSTGLEQSVNTDLQSNHVTATEADLTGVRGLGFNSQTSNPQGLIRVNAVPDVNLPSSDACLTHSSQATNPQGLGRVNVPDANPSTPNAPSTLSSGECIASEWVNSEVADGVRIELTLLGSETELDTNDGDQNTEDLCNMPGREAEPPSPIAAPTQEARVTKSPMLTPPFAQLREGRYEHKRANGTRVTRARKNKSQPTVHEAQFSQSIQHRNSRKGQKPHKCTHCGACFTYYGSLYRHLRTHSQKRVNIHADDKAYKCDETECGETFTEHRQLVAHMTKHTGVKPYKCKDCDAAFTTARALRVHTLTHHADKTRVRKYQCTECGKRFFHKGHLKDHVNIHSGKRPYKCTQCGKCFKQSGALRMHRTVHTEERPFVCELLCGAKFKQRGQLNVHMATHSDEKAHQCELCGVRLRSKWALQQHAIVHTDERPYKCDICNATFKRPESLKIHIEGHSGEKKHLCSVCGAKFTTAASCRVHMRSHTGEKPYRCAVCGAAFSHHYALSEHKGLHTDERRYKCDECGKSFRFSSNLRAHKLTHLNSRPHKCSTCGDTFKTPYSLRKHFATHSAETPFECSECGAAFALPERLKRHLKTHMKQPENDEPKAEQGIHLCDICGATFSKAKSLVDHRASKHAVQKPQNLTSTNPAPHTTRCVECGAGFALEKHLKSHMRTHNGQKLHKCPTCGAGFNSARTLREHVRTHPQNLTCDECGATFDRVKKLQGHKLAHLKASGQCRRAQSNASKPFQCQDCGRGFGTAKRLKYHKCVHGAEKPYKCTQCSASFLRVRYLKSHMLTHTGDKPFVCEVCCSSFASSFALSAHKGRVHTVSKQNQSAQDAAVILSEMYAT